MSKVIAIALNTFKEAVRNKVLYFLLIFAIVIMGFSAVISDLSIAAPEKLIKDLGLAAIDFFGFLIAVFVGVYLVYNELDRKTIYTIVSKPIDRTQFLLGKFFGLLFTIYVNMLIMAFVLFFVLYFRHAVDYEVMNKAMFKETTPGEYVQVQSTFMYYLSTIGSGIWNALKTIVGFGADATTAGLMKVVIMSGLGLSITTAFAILFSTFSTPTLSAVFTGLTWVIGRLCDDIVRYADTLVRKVGAVDKLAGVDQFKYWFAEIIVRIVPNLTLFNQRMEAAYGKAELWAMTEPPLVPWQVVLYAVVYSAGVLALAAIIFRRRNFK